MSNRIQTLALVVLGAPALGLALPPATSSADSIHAPHDCPTIQEALFGIHDGDE